MAVAVIVLVIIAAGVLCLRKYKNRLFKDLPAKGNEFRVFYPVSMWIIDEFRKQGIDICGGDNNNSMYTIRKISQALAFIMLGCVFSIAYGIFSKGNGINELMRPGYGQESVNVGLEINGIRSDIEVYPVLFDLETIENNFVLAYEYLLREIPGENTSLQNVTENLDLITYIEEYAINVSWYSNQFDVIDTEGNVYNRYFNEGEIKQVVLTATLSCQDYSCIYNIDVVVSAPLLDADERIVRNAEAVIWNDNVGDRLAQSIHLPESVDGTRMRYKLSGEHYEWLFLLGGFAAAAAVYFGRDSEMRKKELLRRNQMMIDYPEIVSKLNILMGAGMSARSAWEKIVHDYKNKKKPRYAYEEMAEACNEIHAGVNEGIAYSNFGKRCNIHEYLKLGAMLEQNVRSGTKGLAAMLEDEAVLAFETRKSMAVRQGEEAGTRLLFPMILMLGVVMIIVMVPALMSLG